MKRYFFFGILLLFVYSLSAQHMTLRDITPEVVKPKKTHGFTVNIKGMSGDNLLCSSGNPYGLFEVDTNLNILNNAVLPQEFKKYSFAYRCTLGNHHIIFIYKSYKSQFLGLLDEHLQLVKTIPLRAIYGISPHLIYSDGTYAYMCSYHDQTPNSGYQWIKLDKDLNILAEVREGLLTTRDHHSAWVKDDVLYVRIGNTLTLYNKDNLQKITSLGLWNESTDYLDMPVSSDVIYGDHVIFEQVTKVKHNESYDKINVYSARLKDYNGKEINNIHIESVREKNKGVDRRADAVLTKEDKMAVACIAQEWQEEGKHKLFENPTLTIQIIGKGATKTVNFGALDEPIAFPMFLLDCEDNKAHLLVGGASAQFHLMEADLENKTLTTLLSKPFEYDYKNYQKPTSYQKWVTETGFYVEFAQRTGLSHIMENQGAYINVEGTCFFVSKDMQFAEAYSSKKYTGMTSYFLNSKISSDSTYTLVRHKEPHYRGMESFYSSDIEYWLFNKKGERQRLWIGKDPKIISLSPTEYYVMETYDGKVFQLKKLTIEP